METSWFAGRIKVRSGFDRCYIPCLPGLFALDVCASIHLYASNASAPLHSVLFGTIDVQITGVFIPSVEQKHRGLQYA